MREYKIETANSQPRNSRISDSPVTDKVGLSMDDLSDVIKVQDQNING